MIKAEQVKEEGVLAYGLARGTIFLTKDTDLVMKTDSGLCLILTGKLTGKLIKLEEDEMVTEVEVVEPMRFKIK